MTADLKACTIPRLQLRMTTESIQTKKMRQSLGSLVQQTHLSFRKKLIFLVLVDPLSSHSFVWVIGFSHHLLSLASLSEDFFIFLFFGEELLLAVHYWIVLNSETYFSFFFLSFFNVKTLPCGHGPFRCVTTGIKFCQFQRWHSSLTPLVCKDFYHVLWVMIMKRDREIERELMKIRFT